jgi:hypothetical protein
MAMRPVTVVLATILTVVAIGSCQSQTVIPFKLIDNRIVVPVSINGKGPFECIIDTGAGSVISTEVAKAIGEHVRLAEMGGGVGEKHVMGGSTTLRSLTLARGIDFTDIVTTIIPFDDTLHVFGKAPIDAIFGTPLFEQYLVTVDYDNQELTLVEKSRASGEISGTVLPIERRGIPVIAAQLDGIPAHFGVDLGARSALLLYTPFVDRNNLRAKYKAGFETITGWGIGGPVHSQIARAEVLKFGGIEVHSIVIRLSTQKSGLTTGTALDGLIGPDVLRQFRTTFDYAQSRVIFQKGPGFGKRDNYDRLGAWFGQQKDAFFVLDLVQGGPADQAGLRKDDVVLAIDGKPTSELLLPDARARLRTLPPGTKVQFEVRRGEQVLHLTASLRDLV